MRNINSYSWAVALIEIPIVCRTNKSIGELSKRLFN